MTDAGTTQDYFILPAPPVGGLSISQDRLDRMKLVHDRTIPIILPSGKNILVNIVFKISVGCSFEISITFIADEYPQNDISDISVMLNCYVQQMCVLVQL